MYKKVLTYDKVILSATKTINSIMKHLTGHSFSFSPMSEFIASFVNFFELEDETKETINYLA